MTSAIEYSVIKAGIINRIKYQQNISKVKIFALIAYHQEELRIINQHH